MFVMRHRELIGGGKDDLLQIAHVITLNMVSLFPVLEYLTSFTVQAFDVISLRSVISSYRLVSQDLFSEGVQLLLCWAVGYISLVN